MEAEVQQPRRFCRGVCAFDGIDFSDAPWHETVDKGHGRIERRRCAAVDLSGAEWDGYANLHGRRQAMRSAGRRRIVRHGHLPEREIQTGIGPVAVRCPRVHDRGAGATGPRVRFTSRILPPYLRRAKSIEELLPWRYHGS